MSKAVKALKDVIAAWDSLPPGNYSALTIEEWLANKMAPAIIKCRHIISSGIKRKRK